VAKVNGGIAGPLPIFEFWGGVVGRMHASGMEVSLRLGWPLWELRDDGDGNELTIDRLFAVSELGLDGPFFELGRSGGSEEAGGGAVYQSGFQSCAPYHRDLRAHPPTDLVALTCRARCAAYEAEILFSASPPLR